MQAPACLCMTVCGRVCCCSMLERQRTYALASSSDPEACTVYVGYIAAEVTEPHLAHLFRSVGDVSCPGERRGGWGAGGVALAWWGACRGQGQVVLQPACMHPHAAAVHAAMHWSGTQRWRLGQGPPARTHRTHVTHASCLAWRGAAREPHSASLPWAASKQLMWVACWCACGACARRSWSHAGHVRVRACAGHGLQARV